jgi:hypothetical protein
MAGAVGIGDQVPQALVGVGAGIVGSGVWLQVGMGAVVDYAYAGRDGGGWWWS